MVTDDDEQAGDDERTECSDAETGGNHPIVGSLGESLPSHTAVIRPLGPPGKLPDAFLTLHIPTLTAA